jgi:cell division protein FtsB
MTMPKTFKNSLAMFLLGQLVMVLIQLLVIWVVSRSMAYADTKRLSEQTQYRAGIESRLKAVEGTKKQVETLKTKAERLEAEAEEPTKRKKK